MILAEWCLRCGDVAGVDIILGCNGMIWLAASAASAENSQSASHAQQPQPNKAAVSVSQRRAVCRVANAVRLLSMLNMLIFPSSILNVCKVSSTAIIACRHRRLPLSFVGAAADLWHM